MSEDISEKKRGKISYYTLDQVATLLNISESKVNYYINLFSQHIKLEVINKQPRLHEKEILKLEFLIDLNSKGISNKQSEDYFNNTAFDDFNSKIDNFIEPNFYEEISNSIKNIENTLSTQNNKQDIYEVYNDIILKINELKNNFDISNDMNTLLTKFEAHSEDMLKNFSDILTEKNNDLIDKISNLLEKSNENRIKRDDNFINEIKKNINILTSAYTIQAEMINEQKENNLKIKILNKISNCLNLKKV